MKKFDISNQVIIMCGISGAGKTKYALKLEEEGFTRLSTDVLIWQKVGAKLFSLPKEEQKRLFAECRDEIFMKFASLLKSGEKVVMDATHCKRKVRDEIRKICSELAIKPVFVYCYAEKDELWNRLSQRKGSGPDDLIVTEKEFHNYWIGFERPMEDETDFIFCKTDIL